MAEHGSNDVVAAADAAVPDAAGAGGGSRRPGLEELTRERARAKKNLSALSELVKKERTRQARIAARTKGLSAEDLAQVLAARAAAADAAAAA